MSPIPVIPFDLKKVALGYPIVTVRGDVVTDFHHFSSQPIEHNCIGVVRGRMLAYNTNGHLLRRYYNSPSDLDLRMLDISYHPESNHDLLIRSYEESV